MRSRRKRDAERGRRRRRERRRGGHAKGASSVATTSSRSAGIGRASAAGVVAERRARGEVHAASGGLRGEGAIVRATIRQRAGPPIMPAVRSPSRTDELPWHHCSPSACCASPAPSSSTAVIVFLALLLAVRYLVFPRLDEYRGRIAADAHARARAAGGDRRASPAAGTAGTRGCPSAASRSATARSPTAPPVLLLPQVDAAGRVDVARRARPAAARAVDRAPELAIRRDKQGASTSRASRSIPRRRRRRSAGRRLAPAPARDRRARRARDRGTTSCAARRSSCSTTCSSGSSRASAASASASSARRRRSSRRRSTCAARSARRRCGLARGAGPVLPAPRLRRRRAAGASGSRC